MKNIFNHFLFASVAFACLEVETLAMITDEEDNKFVATLLHDDYEKLKEDKPEQSTTGSKQEGQPLTLSLDKINDEIQKIKETTTQKVKEAFQKPQGFGDEEAGATKDTDKYAAVLSLDGGGFRGLMEAYWLDHLANKDVANRQPYQIFNLIAGTSIGGILALAAVTPSSDNEKVPVLSTQGMINLFKDSGDKIFPQRNKYNIPGKIYDVVTETLWSRYQPDSLEDLLILNFRDKRLKSALTNVIVTSAITKQDPVLFSSFDKQTQDYMMFEVGRATSAAPTYFKAFPLILPKATSKRYLMDGGVWKNNPAGLACLHALKWAEQMNHNITKNNGILLSLGTGIMPIHEQPANAGWLNSIQPLIEAQMNLSSQGVHQSLLEFFPKENYKRINPVLKSNIELDKIGQESVELLEKAAMTQYDEIENFVKDGRLRKILEKDEIMEKNH